MANMLAHAVLLGWPVVTLVLFRRLSPAVAVSVAIVAGYLLLPLKPTFNFPMMPPIGKEEILGLSLLLAAFITVDQKTFTLRGWLPQQKLIWTCAILFVLVPLGTVLTNGDRVIRTAGSVQTGLTLYDVASMLSDLLMIVIPFVVARRYLAAPAAHRMVLTVLCVAALLYTIPTLWEVRMSPQLNSDIYGFFPHDWRQHIRDGGFRPLVFLRHGLLLGMFLSLGVLAAAALWRISLKGRGATIRTAMATLFLLATLVLSKNLGATLIALIGLATILLLPARRWLLIAALISTTVLTYPVLRSAGLVPTDKVVSVLSGIAGSGRILSLEFRLRNEDILLERANEKPLFGWGRWGRARVYVDGRDITTTDGTWIITYGEGGLLGYLAVFGLLALPPILLAFKRGPALEPASAALALLLAVNLIDLLPNSGLSPVTWMLAGALAGRLEWRPSAATAHGPEIAAAGGRVPRMPYARSFDTVRGGGAPSLRRDHP
ncbi:hypothetical protein [Jannaschia sp. W003]|uniref:hypothetical protein n=1 Tax=Jannaschia sp. W003 TaxID=2867012 RepID=UPI0021A87844|nr:hypothetical protein [Jannaschia sp. W003]UWQ23220.1 hypothetical protein K3554_16655 [Jannaschia sp. W003]